jgi:hypothetical protein
MLQHVRAEYEVDRIGFKRQLVLKIVEPTVGRFYAGTQIHFDDTSAASYAPAASRHRVEQCIAYRLERLRITGR